MPNRTHTLLQDRHSAVRVNLNRGETTRALEKKNIGQGMKEQRWIVWYSRVSFGFFIIISLWRMCCSSVSSSYLPWSIYNLCVKKFMIYLEPNAVDAKTPVDDWVTDLSLCHLLMMMMMRWCFLANAQEWTSKRRDHAGHRRLQQLQHSYPIYFESVIAERMPKSVVAD